ncbi:glutamine-hydrolyzing GMP synthase [bacterium]|nr:glutamine-hydrolyzing GMP synthase [bacterium]NCQ55062.1 glutamine-hydrolyzing GMP synthase [Candidatus Parcubacteria bacterium]NCS67106.1 glutamine-hydrolyzing GMP synthase [Candidatus Peregrinibacteria bacterium]NCS96052.1 glutamine-hydrolyzing GMP synthase [bacterium]
MHQKVIILDFGGQYAHLIASRIRREQVLAEIHQPDEVDLSFFQDEMIKGIILSGGPQSVYDEGSASCDTAIFELGIPVLGICYGHQFLNQALGGKVIPGKDSGKEFGRADLTHDGHCPLFKDIPKTSPFWMSHGDEVSELGKGFDGCASTDLCHNAAVWNETKKLFGIQFHPEVTHSQHGSQLLKNFLDICEVNRDWTIEKFYEEHQASLKKEIGDKHVVLFVSGGVDSTVAFALLSKILGADRVQGLFVDTGLLRQDERDYVEKAITDIGARLTVMDEADRFLGNLAGVYDPEKKREIIGNTFLEVQRAFFKTHQLDENTVLAQGTIYPDTIETGGTKNAATIKTHHNRVPEIQKMIDAGLVIEPLADLYKDEVRALGELMGLPHELVWRHPFPGPGLGVRILCSGELTEESTHRDEKSFSLQRNKKPFDVLPLKSVGVQGDFRTYKHPGMLTVAENDLAELESLSTKLINHYPDINRCVKALGHNYKGRIESTKVLKADINLERVARLQRADHIVTTTMHEMGVYNDVWQFPVVLAPLSFNNTGEESVILRPIDSIDAMSATVGKLPWEFFEKVTAEILKDDSISAVFLDVTSKPPGTIEWE